MKNKKKVILGGIAIIALLGVGAVLGFKLPIVRLPAYLVGIFLGAMIVYVVELMIKRNPSEAQ